MQESNQEVPAWLSCYATRSSYGGGRSNGEYGTSGSSYGGEEYDCRIDYREEKLQETILPILATYAWLIFGPRAFSYHSLFFDFENKFPEFHFVNSWINSDFQIISNHPSFSSRKPL